MSDMSSPIYPYATRITCKTCGEISVYTLLSLNPNKERLTFRERNPLTGLHNLPSVHRLLCGHRQDIEGELVTRKDLTKG